MPSSAKNVFVLAFANAQLLDVTGPLQVFASANDRARGLGLPLPYNPRVIANPGGATLSSSGLALLADALPAPEVACDTLIIAGGWGVYEAARDPELVA
ncbi:AraC family transcriptional regulator, partial [Pseudomonas protegens]